MRLTAVQLREIVLPLVEPFVISSGRTETRRILLLRLVGDDGTEVWSEGVCGSRPNYSPETIDTAWLVLRQWLIPRAMRLDWDHPSEVRPALEREARGHPMAKAALEMGCWGLAAASAGKSLADYLGGPRENVEVGISIGIQASPAVLAAKARSSAAQGYRKIKLKITRGADIDYVAAVREALGPDIALAVDANAAYTLRDARRLAELDQFGLTMIEQPLAAGDLRRHAELQQQLETPVCLDESVTSPEDVEDMLALGSGRIVNIKPGRVGGYQSSLEIHRICRRADVPVWCGGMLESGIGRAYNVALATLPGFTMPGDLSPSRRYWARDVVTPEWTMSEDGLVTAPRRIAGIGVEVDTDLVDSLTQRHETVRSPAGSPDQR